MGKADAPQKIVNRKPQGTAESKSAEVQVAAKKMCIALRFPIHEQ